MFFEFDDFDVRDRFYAIEEKSQRLNLHLEGLTLEKRHEFRSMCVSAYVYHDSALDGMVVTGDEISSVFSAANYRPYVRSRVMQEIKNHRDMVYRLQTEVEKIRSMNAVYQCEIVRMNDVVDMHRVLYSNVARKEAGKLRKVIPLHSAYFHSFIEPNVVERNLEELCQQTEHPEFRAQHPINQAVLFHRQFMNVFPFLEGSGKVGRLCMNGFLMQGGYNFAIIHGSERQRYYETLRDGAEQLRELLLDNMESALDAQLKYVGEVDLPKNAPKVAMRVVGLN
jgi:Fic family protein